VITANGGFKLEAEAARVHGTWDELKSFLEVINAQNGQSGCHVLPYSLAASGKLIQDTL